MKNITDEMLNDYVDNQLDASSVEELKAKISSDEEVVNKLKALKAVDQSLHNLEVYEAPESITEKIMNIVYQRARSVKPKANYFFGTVVAAFLITIAAALASAWVLVDKDSSSAQTTSLFESVKTFFGENVGLLKNFVDNNAILFAGGVLTMILFISAVFVLDSHKNFKNKLKSITH